MGEPELVFNSAIDSLFTYGIKGQVGPVLKEKLRGVGLDLDKKLRPAYERAQWVRILDITLAEAFRGVPRSQAFRSLGKLVTKGFEQTLIGKSVVAVTRVIGPRRTLERLTRSLRAANNYVTANVKALGPGDCEVHCQGLDSPDFMAGIVEAGMEFCQAKDLSVVIQSQSAAGEAVLRVRWKE